MVTRNKIFLFKIKHQAKHFFPNDVERTVISFVFIFSLSQNAKQIYNAFPNEV